jgi:serine/threonine protein kinase
VANESDIDAEALEKARQWCGSKGKGWSVGHQIGRGGTAPVFEISAPEGLRALKVYDQAFSVGEKGKVEFKRIEQQIALKGHDCASLVQVYDGGVFEDRLYLLMSRAPWKELEKCLPHVPREKIRKIVDQVARAVIFLRGKDLCHRDVKSANVFVSDDFDHATLLDLSVTRNIYDPVGLGTDHDGQLPVVATARYSPPEYLFRLIEPSAELWHALDVYQLGGIVHDLIMREPLFQAEYLRSRENRYRFAWIVAMVDPTVHADDVDQDLVLLARRGLDKDWHRRSALTLEDFLADSTVQQDHALSAIGLGPGAPQDSRTRSGDVAARLQRVTGIARSLYAAIIEHLRHDRVRAEHFLEPGPDDQSKKLRFRWKAPMPGNETSFRTVEFCLNLRLRTDRDNIFFESSAELGIEGEGIHRQVAIDLPRVEDASADSLLASQAVSALARLAIDISRAH